MADFRRLPVPVTEVWDWQMRGACRDLDSAVFFHPDRERGAAKDRRDAEAKQVCRRCPVIEQCRRHALSTREPYGVWGGLTVAERDAYVDQTETDPGTAGVGAAGFRTATTATVVVGEFDIEPLRACRRHHLHPGRTE